MMPHNASYVLLGSRPAVVLIRLICRIVYANIVQQRSSGVLQWDFSRKCRGSACSAVPAICQLLSFLSVSGLCNCSICEEVFVFFSVNFVSAIVALKQGAEQRHLWHSYGVLLLY